MNLNKVLLLALLALFACNGSLLAQEFVVPLKSNPVVESAALKAQPAAAKKKSRAVLPFVDDFSYEGPYPDPNLWTDRQAYINNTMSNTQPTRGMATLDGLNQYGRPYYPGQFSSGLADSLTSVDINLSSFSAASNIYLSFFYQPQGLGFAPETDDSLFLYFQNSSNQWVRMWQTWGTPLQPFRPVLIPVTDPQFLHAGFRFRFVNMASLNLNNDVWNIDYVKLDANRNIADSVMDDLAFTLPPTSVLFPYSAMPYRHFNVNPSANLSALQAFQVRNLYAASQNLNTFHEAKELVTAASVSSFTLSPATVGGKTSINQSVPSYPISLSPPDPQSELLLRNTYYFTSPAANDRRANDTINTEAVFGNYFAYDDGSPEKAYFLYPAFNYPSKTALQFELAQPDTVRGVSVFFAAQAPTGAGKYFSLVLYKQLAGSGLNDSIIRQEDLYQVKYDTLPDGFVTYAFSTPVPLDAGTYYLGLTQPANFGSDSVYYGLDVNNNTSSQHLYYNVDGNWFASSVNGSVMMRPIVGPFFTPTGVANVQQQPAANSFTLWPVPAHDRVYLEQSLWGSDFRVLSLTGQCVLQGSAGGEGIPVQALPSGVYVMECRSKTNAGVLRRTFTKN